MTMLTYRSSRLAWLWCVAYTAVTPHDTRDRRRGEIRSHLWESEAASLPSRTVAFAALRGLHHDLAWAAASGATRVLRSFATPTPYIATAPLFPIQAWIVSATVSQRTAGPYEFLGMVGGGAMLAMAAAVWLFTRRRG
jgi:hypothetical protein